MTNYVVGITLKSDGSGAVISDFKKVGDAGVKVGKGLDAADKSGSKAAKSMSALKGKMAGVTSATGSAARALTGLTGIFAGLTAIGLGATFVKAASTAEQYRVRLNVLLGSQSESNRLFKEMADYAGRVPFEYEKVMNSATALTGVMQGGVDEVKQWVPLIGDLAAASGLSIEDTTSQVIRMYSAGAQAAEMFKERGITQMLGFQNGVSYSAEETRKKLIAAWEDPASRFRGAADELGKTWSGMLSMISDKWFQVRNIIMDAGVFDYLKGLVGVIDDEFNQVLDTSKQKANEWAMTIIDGIGAIVVGFAHVADMVDLLAGSFEFLSAVLYKGPIAQVRALKAEFNSLQPFLNHPILQPFKWAFGANNEKEFLEDQRDAVLALAEVQELLISARERGNRNLSEQAEKLHESLVQRVQVTKAARDEAMANDAAAGAAQNHTTAISTQSDATNQAAKEMDNWRKKLANTKTLVDNFPAKLRELWNEFKQGELTWGEYNKAVKDASAIFKDMVPDIKKVGDEAETTGNRIGTIWENMLENMQRNFGDYIHEGLWGEGGEGESRWRKFTDSIKNIWKRMLSEMIAAWFSSGIAGLFSGKGFADFSFGSLFGGKGLAGLKESFSKIGQSIGLGKIGAALGLGKVSTGAKAIAMGSSAPLAESAQIITLANPASGAASGLAGNAGIGTGAATIESLGGLSAPAGAAAGGSSSLLATAGWAAGALALGSAVSKVFSDARDSVASDVSDMFAVVGAQINNTEVAAAGMGDTLGVVMKNGAESSELLKSALKSVNAEIESGGQGILKITSNAGKARAVTRAWTSEAVSGMQAQVRELMSSAAHTGQYENSAMALRGAIAQVGSEFASLTTEAAGAASAIKSIPREVTTTVTTVRRSVSAGSGDGGGGFADGGISYGPQLAWVSEGRYPVEAHVPLPNGRSIPVDIRGGSPSNRNMERLMEASLRVQSRQNEQIRQVVAAVERKGAETEAAIRDVKQQIRANQ